MFFCKSLTIIANMKLKIEDSLPEYMTPELVKSFSIKHLKSVADLQIAKLAIETFWLNLHQTCKDMPLVIDSMSVTINALYSNPYRHFGAFLYKDGINLDYVYANQRETQALTININLNKEVDTQKLETVKNKIKARLKIATLYHGLKLLNVAKTDNIFLMALKPHLGKEILITKDTNPNSLVNLILPDDIAARREAVIQKDELIKEIKEVQYIPQTTVSSPRNKI